MSGRLSQSDKEEYLRCLSPETIVVPAQKTPLLPLDDQARPVNIAYSNFDLERRSLMTSSPAEPVAQDGFLIEGRFCITLGSQIGSIMRLLLRYQLFLLLVMTAFYIVLIGYIAVMHGREAAFYNIPIGLRTLAPILLIALFFPHLVNIGLILRMPKEAREVHFTITEKEIVTEDAAGSRLVLQWNQLKKVRRWKNHLYLEFRTRGIRMLPARAFAPEDFERLTAYAKSLLTR